MTSNNNKSRRESFNDGFAIEGAHVSFEAPGGGRRAVLRDLTLTAGSGEFVVVIGPNGAGKSTLVNAIAGAVPLDSGEVFIDGTRLTGRDEAGRAQWIGRVFQDPRAGTAEMLTVEENLSLAMSRGRRRSLLRRAVSSRRREDFRNLLRPYGRGLEDRLGHRVSALSGGQRQVISLAMAVANEPKMLLLDEHTSSLDPEMAQTVMDLTSEVITTSRLTTVMVTHNMAHAQAYGDRLVLLHSGEVVGELSDDEKKAMDALELVSWFRERAGGEISDRMLGGE